MRPPPPPPSLLANLIYHPTPCALPVPCFCLSPAQHPSSNLCKARAHNTPATETKTAPRRWEGRRTGSISSWRQVEGTSTWTWTRSTPPTTTPEPRLCNAPWWSVYVPLPYRCLMSAPRAVLLWLDSFSLIGTDLPIWAMVATAVWYSLSFIPFFVRGVSATGAARPLPTPNLS